jgi:hypothetical protein
MEQSKMAKPSNINDPKHPHHIPSAIGVKLNKNTIASDPNFQKGMQLTMSGNLEIEITKEHQENVNPDGSVEQRFEGVRRYFPNPQ